MLRTLGRAAVGGRWSTPSDLTLRLSNRDSSNDQIYTLTPKLLIAYLDGARPVLLRVHTDGKQSRRIS